MIDRIANLSLLEACEGISPKLTSTQKSQMATLSRSAVIHLVGNFASAANVRFDGPHRGTLVSRQTATKGRPRRRPNSLDFNRFCNRKSIVQLDAQIPNRAVHLCMAAQELNRT